MKYKINIQKFIENPKFSEELEEYKEKNKYKSYPNGSYELVYSSEMIGTTALDCELTEEEFKAIKKAVLEVV